MSNKEEEGSSISFQVFRDTSKSTQQRLKHGKALVRRQSFSIKNQFQILLDVTTAELQDGGPDKSQWWTLMADVTDNIYDLARETHLYTIRKRFIKELIDSLNDMKLINSVVKVAHSIITKKSLNALTCLNIQDRIMMLCGLVKRLTAESSENDIHYHITDSIENLIEEINSTFSHSSFNTQLALLLISDLLPTILGNTQSSEDNSENQEINQKIFVQLKNLLTKTIIQRDSLKYIDKYFAIIKDKTEPGNSSLLHEKGVNVFTELFKVLKDNPNTIITDFFIRYTNFKDLCNRKLEFLSTCINLSVNEKIQSDLTLNIWSKLLQHAADHDVLSYSEPSDQAFKHQRLTFTIKYLLNTHNHRTSRDWFVCMKSLIALDHTVITKNINTLLTTILDENTPENTGYSDECMCEIMDLYHRLRQTEKFLSVYCELITSSEKPIQQFQPKSAERFGEMISQTPSATVVKILESILNLTETAINVKQTSSKLEQTSLNLIELISIIMYNMKMYDGTTPHTVQLQLVHLMVKLKETILPTLITKVQLNSVVVLCHNYISVYDILQLYCENLKSELIPLEPREIHGQVKTLILKSLKDDMNTGEIPAKIFNYMIKLLINVKYDENSDSTVDSLRLISEYCTARGEIELTTLNCILYESGMLQLLIDTKTNNALIDIILLMTQMYLIPTQNSVASRSIIDTFLSSVQFLESAPLHTAVLQSLTNLTISFIELYTQPAQSSEQQNSTSEVNSVVYLELLGDKILETDLIKDYWDEDMLQKISTELNKFISDFQRQVDIAELIDLSCTIFSCMKYVPVEELSKIQTVLLSVVLIFISSQITQSEKQRTEDLHSLLVRLLTNPRSAHFITSMNLNTLMKMWTECFSENQMSPLCSALVKLYFHTNNLSQLQSGGTEYKQLHVLTIHNAVQRSVNSNEYTWGKSTINMMFESENISTTDLKSSELCGCLAIILEKETGPIKWADKLTDNVLYCLKTNYALKDLNSDQQTALVKLLTVLSMRENRPTRLNLCVTSIGDEIYTKYLNSALTRADNSQINQLKSQLMAGNKDGFELGLTESVLCWRNLISCSFKDENQKQCIVDFIQQAVKLLTVDIGDRLLNYSVYPGNCATLILSQQFQEYFQFFTHITTKGRPFITSQDISRIFQQLHLLNFNLLDPSVLFQFISRLVAFLQSAILNFETFVVKSAPTLIDVIKSLIAAVIRCGDQQFLNDCTQSDESRNEIESIVINCCHEINKLMTVVIKHKTEINKLTPYVISDFIDALSTVTLLPSIKKRLLLCLNPLLDISDEHSIMLLKTNLNEGPRQIFITIYEQYTKYHKYSGRV